MRDRVLTLSVFDDPATCDPHLAYDSASRHIALNVYEPLLRYDPATRLVTPCLANEVVGRDGGDDRRYRIRIRDGVRFHDGSTLTSEDVVYSLRRAIFTHSGGASLWLDALLGPAHLDPTVDNVVEASCRIRSEGRDVTITLLRPFSPLPYLLAHWSLVVSRRWAVEQGEWDGDLATIARFAFPTKTNLTRIANGTGAFRLVSWDEDLRRVVFGANQGHWCARPDAARVVLLSEDDNEERECSLMQGRVDFAVCHPNSLSTLSAASEIEVVELPDEWVVNPLGFFAFSPAADSGSPESAGSDGRELRRDALSDYHLRHALALCIDYDAFRRRGLAGRFVDHYGPFPEPSLAHGPKPAFRFDLREARAHLEQVAGGRIVDEGFTLHIHAHATNSAREHAADLLARGFTRLAPTCRAEVRRGSFNDVLADLYAARCPVSWIGWDADYKHPHSIASLLLGSRYFLPKALGMCFPEIDALLDRALETPYPRNEAIYREIAEIAIRQQTHLFMPGKVSYLAYRSTWEGVRTKDGVSNVLDFASFRLRSAGEGRARERGSTI